MPQVPITMAINITVDNSDHGDYEGMTEFLGIIKTTDAVREDIKDLRVKVIPEIKTDAGT
jgi:hypothetical protein